MPTIKIKRGSLATMPILQDGELALARDTKDLYVGVSGANYKLTNNSTTTHPVQYESTSQGPKLSLNSTLFPQTTSSLSVVDLRGYSDSPSTLLAPYTFCCGYNTKSNGFASFSCGNASIAGGHSAFVAGNQNNASGNYSAAFGSGSIASGIVSISLGKSCQGIGDNSVAIGTNCIAGGTSSTAIGNYTKASAVYSFAAGTYNRDTDSGGTFLARDAFVIGNGSSEAIRGNCFRVTFGGAVYGLSAFNSSGADFAEYFEWNDKNPKSECRLGLFVKVVNGDKIAIANSTDEVLGIISATPTIVGNSNSEIWEKMYVKDKFGRIIHEENEDGVLIPKINPDFDSSQPYISRENRPEWDAVGIIGRVKVIDKGACHIGGFCKCGSGGFAIPSKSGYRILRRISNDVIEILFK